MKINWGTGLAITLGIFILGMGTVTYKALNQRNDLVTTDYYAKEIAFQETIDNKKNAAALEEKCVLSLQDGSLQLSFPTSLIGSAALSAEIEMYSPTHAEKDFLLNYQSWTIANIDLPAEKLSAGKWIAKIKLDTDSNDYYFETEIVLP